MPVDNQGNLYDSKPWRTKTDPHNIRNSAPNTHRYYPSSRKDLIGMVLEAQLAPDPKPEIRACGSHWALNDSAIPNAFFIETQDPQGDRNDLDRPRLNRTLYDVIPHCLSPQALRFFTGQSVPPYDTKVKAQHSAFYLYHVEAGTKIFELYSRLDLGDDNEPRSLVNFQFGGLTFKKYSGSWAMQTLGGAGGQTVVGAISTGTHGGDVHLPAIADAVQAVHLICPGLNDAGEPEPRQYWIERDLPFGYELVDEAKIKALYPEITLNNGRCREIEVIRDPDVLNAVIVGVGRFGIIYSVVFRAVHQYALKEDRFKDTWSNVRNWIGNPSHSNFGFSTGFGNRFVQVLINPNRQTSFDPLHPWEIQTKSEHSCFVTFRTLEALDAAKKPPFGRAERVGDRVANSPDDRPEFTNAGKTWHLDQDSGSGDFFNTICESADPIKAALSQLIDAAKVVRAAALVTAGVLFLALYNPFTPEFLRPSIEKAMNTALATAALAQAFIALIAWVRNNFQGRFGTYVGGIANWAAESDHMEVLRHIAEFGICNDQKDRNITGISYGILDYHDYPDIGCSAEGKSLEVFFDHNSPSLVPYIEKLFQRMIELENGWMIGPKGETYGKRAFPGYVSVRFMSRSAGLIAMQKWPRVCSLEIAGFTAAKGTEPFLDRVEQDAVDMGGTVHWGQRNTRTMKDIELAYDANGPNGALFRWRQALSRLSRNGRLASFSTEFTRIRGLEIVQPIIASFTVSPTEACAGSMVLASWMAADNPPGTTAVLLVTPVGGSPEVIELGSQLEGSRSITLPAGYTDIEFIVSYELNGRPLQDPRKIRVRGYVDHDVIKFQKEAVCWVIDGTARWAEDITFGSLVPDNLRVEEIHCHFLASPKWYVRRAGLADLSFTAGADRHTLPDLPKLRGSSWLFFVHEPGCGGGATPPKLHAEFKIRCSE